MSVIIAVVQGRARRCRDGEHVVELVPSDRPDTLSCDRCGLLFVRDDRTKQGYRPVREGEDWRGSSDISRL